ncbi:MAG: mechanosensitive ion channel domain-containing protein [Gammaproteobacteria bacterium]
MTRVFDIALSLLPSLVMLGLVIGVFFVIKKLLRSHYAALPGSYFKYQVLQLGVVFVGILIVVVVLPVGQTLRGQLLSLIGLIISAAIALSSTTFIGNMMAGIMLRTLRKFRPGDFIRVGDYFGRISVLSLLHVEIQTEDRDLVTLPNLLLVTQPMTVVYESGTIIAATVSLGYDIPRARIETCLLRAAKQAGLEDPFMQILELGDYAVTYRIAGLLTEVKQLISARSRLRSNMLDELHAAKVEIVSPHFMNLREYEFDRSFIPERSQQKVETAAKVSPEDVVFDKAEEAENVERMRERLGKLNETLRELDDKIGAAETPEQKTALQADKQRMQSRLERLNQTIRDAEKSKQKN